MLTMKQKYSRIDFSKLPDSLKSELEVIKEGTEDFSDDDLIDVFQDNFDTAYGMVEEKYPDALKKGKTLKKVVKPSVKRIKKVAKPKAEKPVKTDTNAVEECKRVLKDANYTITLKREKGKPVRKKVKRPDKTIIREKNDDVVTTIVKDIAGNEEKEKEYKETLATVVSLKNLIGRLYTLIDSLVQQNSHETLKKIEKGLREIIPD